MLIFVLGPCYSLLVGRLNCSVYIHRWSLDSQFGRHFLHVWLVTSATPILGMIFASSGPIPVSFAIRSLWWAWTLFFITGMYDMMYAGCYRLLCFLFVCFRYYGYIMNNFLEPKLQELADQSSACLTIVFNCVVAQYSLSPPLKLPCSRRPAASADSSGSTVQRVACLNMAANVFGHMPLIYSKIRVDPVLYKDNVSIYRKEYRRMEVS